METFLYYLLQWEDRLMSIIKKDKIVQPIQKQYKGQLITAKYGQQTYEAVICEIHPNLKYLQGQAKLPSKYSYVEAKKCQLSGVTSQPASDISIWEDDESDDVFPDLSPSMLETVSWNSPHQDESDDGNTSDVSLGNQRPSGVALSEKKPCSFSYPVSA